MAACQPVVWVSGVPITHTTGWYAAITFYNCVLHCGIIKSALILFDMCNEQFITNAHFSQLRNYFILKAKEILHVSITEGSSSGSQYIEFLCIRH
jgi:hypothetical protein